MSSLLGLCVFAIGIIWALGEELPFEPEPIAMLLAMLGSAITAGAGYLKRRLKRAKEELEEERFSTPVALAFGYFRNFLSPALTKLLDEREPRSPPLRFLIYIPEKLDELGAESRKRLLAKIRDLSFEHGSVSLAMDRGDPRHLLTLMKSAESSAVYFDFPTTLLTLEALIDYKLHSEKDSFSKARRVELGVSYIARFEKALKQELVDADLASFVRFTDRRLDLESDLEEEWAAEH
ncbi:MAG: STING domain-containing protein [Verrucomicrobiota bacterium]